MPTHVVYMVEKPPSMQEEYFREALSPEQSSNWRILQQRMVRSKDKGTVGSISKEDIWWAIGMIGSMDALCTHIVSMWWQVVDTVTGTMGAISYAPLLVLRQLAAKQFIPVTNGLSQLEFLYEESGAMKKVDQLLQVWKQTIRMSTENLSCKVTLEYMVWRANKVEDVVIPFGMEDVQSEKKLPEMPSELEIAKQMFEEEKKKMRIESRKQ